MEIALFSLKFVFDWFEFKLIKPLTQQLYFSLKTHRCCRHMHVFNSVQIFGDTRHICLYTNLFSFHTDTCLSMTCSVQPVVDHTRWRTATSPFSQHVSIDLLPLITHRHTFTQCHTVSSLCFSLLFFWHNTTNTICVNNYYWCLVHIFWSGWLDYMCSSSLWENS